MALRSDWSARECPIARGVDAIGDPWVLLILREALSGSRRFAEFRGALGVADNILTDRLAQMVERGLLTREPCEGRRRRFRYLPTAAAEDALPILHAFALWADEHAPHPTARMGLRCLACGELSSTGERCSQCGILLRAGRVVWERPWADTPRIVSGAGAHDPARPQSAARAREPGRP